MSNYNQKRYDEAIERIADEVEDAETFPEKSDSVLTECIIESDLVWDISYETGFDLGPFTPRDVSLGRAGPVLDTSDWNDWFQKFLFESIKTSVKDELEERGYCLQ
jgi:hypothetical protein